MTDKYTAEASANKLAAFEGNVVALKGNAFEVRKAGRLVAVFPFRETAPFASF